MPKHVDGLGADCTKQKYRKRYQYRNFVAIFFGYAGYYLLRENFALAVPHLLDSGFTKTQLGLAFSGIPIAYGVSRLLMGFISDRTNPRYFLTLGMVVSAIVNFIFGFFLLSGGQVGAVVILAFALFNGLAQGMGAAPCYRVVSYWFPSNQHGRVMSAWSISPNIGSTLLGLIVAYALPKFTSFSWQAIFYLPAIIVILIAIVTVLVMTDLSQKNTSANCNKKTREIPFKKTLKIIFSSRQLQLLALLSIFVYFIRYGILDWAPTYLHEVKGMSVTFGGKAFALYEAAGIAGTLLCGYISDKWFKSNRTLFVSICLSFVLLGNVGYWFCSGTFAIKVFLSVIGMFVYGLITLLGIQVLQTAPKKVVGAVVGMMGITSYWGGTFIASSGLGWLTDRFGWYSAALAILAATVLAIITSLSMFEASRKAAAKKSKAKLKFNQSGLVEIENNKETILKPNAVVLEGGEV